MATLIEIEKPLEKLLDQLEKAEHIQKESDVDVSKTIKDLEKKIKEN